MFSLTPLHTFGLPAATKHLLIFEDVPALQHYFAHDHDARAPWCILAGGSNTIFLEDFAGMVICPRLMGIEYAETQDAWKVAAAAGENWHALVEACLAKDIRGLENLALIPGTVGAAPIQNIGAYGVEVERFIERVEYLDIQTGELRSLRRGECQFGYRDSIFKHELAGKYLITKVHFAFSKDWQPVLGYAELQKLDASTVTAVQIKECVIAMRQSKLPDPQEQGNAGSFFKNPIIPTKQYKLLKQAYPDIPSFPAEAGFTKVPAAWLIQQAGFKGQERDGICCHPCQPLVLTNTGKGTGKALVAFAKEIIAKVDAMFAIELENEVRLMQATGLYAL